MRKANELTGPEKTELTKAICASVSRLSVSSTVAVLGMNPTTSRQIGSGTLLAVADRRFVLTAAHVIRQATEMKCTIGIGATLGSGITLAPNKWLLSAKSQGDDRLDVALCELDDSERFNLNGSEYVRIADACFDRNLSDSFFVVSGFPAIWSTTSNSSEKKMKAKLLRYATFVFSGSTVGLNGFQTDNHFLVQASPSELVDENGIETDFRMRSGYKARMPGDLLGMSGCSVWRVGRTTEPPSSWGNYPSQIVGVQTGVYSDVGAIKATRWNAVTSLLYKAYPDLRSAIDLYRGARSP
jgi:hypothetical protein